MEEMESGGNLLDSVPSRIPVELKGLNFMDSDGTLVEGEEYVKELAELQETTKRRARRPMGVRRRAPGTARPSEPVVRANCGHLLHERLCLSPWPMRRPC